MWDGPAVMQYTMAKYTLLVEKEVMSQDGKPSLWSGPSTNAVKLVTIFESSEFKRLLSNIQSTVEIMSSKEPRSKYHLCNIVQYMMKRGGLHTQTMNRNIFGGIIPMVPPCSQLWWALRTFATNLMEWIVASKLFVPAGHSSAFSPWHNFKGILDAASLTTDHG